MENNDRIDKIRATVLYVASTYNKLKGDLISMHHISKILYFADQKHLIRYGRPIIEDNYIAMPYGPVPSLIYNGFKVKKGIEDKSLDVFGNSVSVEETRITALQNPDMDEFSPSDLECLDESISENKNLSFSELTNKSHGSAWTNNRGGTISLLDIAHEAGADDELLKYISETN